MTLFENNNIVTLAVRDNGVGFNSQLTDKMFAYGFSTKKNRKGFSLHDCANYTTQMRGTIHSESEGNGMGTLFSVSFPAKK